MAAEAITTSRTSQRRSPPATASNLCRAERQPVRFRWGIRWRWRRKTEKTKAKDKGQTFSECASSERSLVVTSLCLCLVFRKTAERLWDGTHQPGGYAVPGRALRRVGRHPGGLVDHWADAAPELDVAASCCQSSSHIGCRSPSSLSCRALCLKPWPRVLVGLVVANIEKALTQSLWTRRQAVVDPIQQCRLCSRRWPAARSRTSAGRAAAIRRRPGRPCSAAAMASRLPGGAEHRRRRLLMRERLRR
jgi:hypothetical protein